MSVETPHASPVPVRNYATHQRLKRRRNLRRQLLRGGVGVALVLASWYVMSNAYNLQLVLPLPTTVLENFVSMLSLDIEPWLYGPGIYQHVLVSFIRAITGFAIAAAVAIPLGLLLGRSRTLREFFGPLIKAFYPIPGVAWIPLAILWFGLGTTSVIFVVAMASFFPLYFNTEDGARNIDALYCDAGRCFGANGFSLFIRVILPATIPFIVTGLRIALGTSWRMIVAAEMLAGQTGVGFILNESRYLFRAPDLMATMIVISIIGFTTEKLLVGTLEKRTVERWEVTA